MEEGKTHAVLDAQTIEQCVIEQDWAAYTPQDHKTWETLFNRQIATLRGHVCSEYFAGLKTLNLVPETICDRLGGRRRSRSESVSTVLLDVGE
jgi:phenylalanine-4-hydroxylase